VPPDVPLPPSPDAPLPPSPDAPPAPDELDAPPPPLPPAPDELDAPPPVPLEELDCPPLPPPLELDEEDWPPSGANPQIPAMHTPPGQAAPSGFTGFEQMPVAASQEPASWQSSSGAQTIGVPLVHAPATQKSTMVHALPSSHATPLISFGYTHCPAPASQTPGCLHCAGGGQTTGLPPAH